jgi:hypothetical protein
MWIYSTKSQVRGIPDGAYENPHQIAWPFVIDDDPHSSQYGRPNDSYRGQLRARSV